MSPMIYYENVKARREDLLREAEKERLIKIAQAGQPTMSKKIQTKLGQMMKKTDQQIQENPAQS